jgi:hypothetical protein
MVTPITAALPSYVRNRLNSSCEAKRCSRYPKCRFDLVPNFGAERNRLRACNKTVVVGIGRAVTLMSFVL